MGGWHHPYASHVGKIVYLATIMDCYSKKIVGYPVAEHIRTDVIRNALEMVVRN